MTGSSYSPLHTVRVTLTVWCISSFILSISICLVLLLPASFLAIFIAAFFFKFQSFLYVSLVTFLSFSLFLSILAELSVVLMKEWVMWVLAWRWSLSYLCQLSGGLASGQAHLDHKRCYRQSVSFMLRWHIDVTKVQCIHTCTYWLHTHTHAHTPPILLLTLTDWCLPVSQGVGVRTILCNWIPVATVYLPPSSSLWQQSLIYSQSLLKSVCFLHVFDFLSNSPFYMLLSTRLLSNPFVSFSLKCSVLPVHAFHRFQNGVHV